MKIALGQIQPHWEDKLANLRKVEEYLQALSEEGTDLFLLPEMSLTGFSMHTERTKEAGKETVEQVRRLAERYQLAIGVGWVKDKGKFCENHYSIVAPEGEILDYTKIHPFSYSGENRYFQGGDGLPVCTYQGFRIGVQICYDLRFPEPFQILSREADIILVPANWPEARGEHWRCLLKARAIENMVYLAGINCAGEAGGEYYAGDSGLYTPNGTELEFDTVCLPGNVIEEQVQIYQIENDVHWYRKRFPVKEDRRDALYVKFQEELWKR